MPREIITDDGDRVLVDDPSYVSYYSPIARVVWTILGIINALLAIRFILRLFGANPGAGFVNFMYSITAPLVAWFTGSIRATSVGTGIIEWSTLLAIAVYWIIAWIITRLVTMSRPVARY
ncbi:MAG TPA: YggT family protein [Patescibacteria group bacterium]|nr:YggT family protein [Patescibacteria group bacterium]